MAISEPSVPSALLTVQTLVVCAAPALLTAVMLHPGSAASTITVYDNATAGSGTVLAVLQGTASGATQIIPFDSPIYAKSGITCTVSGTAAQGQVYFQREG
jgi:hypothetical protein